MNSKSYKQNKSQRNVISKFNFIGFKTLIDKEVTRFMSVYLQTIIAPVITTLLFYFVFVTVFQNTDRQVFGLPFIIFLAPGLIMMSMSQNAFANTSSSLIVAKMQGSLSDILIAPLSPLALLGGYVIGGIIRGVVIGVLSILVLIFFLKIPIYSVPIILLFSFLGCASLALLGVLGGIWAEKFDHLSAISNFVIMPLSFLSGTFYSIERLSPFWQSVAGLNPFFYMIDGFRYGFLGQGDSNIIIGAAFLSSLTLALWLITYAMFKAGYRLKN